MFDSPIKKMAPDIQLMNSTNKEINYYRRLINITNSGSALTNEIICIKIDHQFLVSRGQSNETFNDLRVYDTNGVTPLSFWVDSPFYNWTKIFVKVPSISASSTKTISIEYGNPTLDNLSNLADVFATATSPNSIFNSQKCKVWVKASDPFPDLRHEDGIYSPSPYFRTLTKFLRNHANIKQSFIGNTLGDNAEDGNLPLWSRDLTTDEQYFAFENQGTASFMTFKTDFPLVTQIPAGSDYEVYLVEKTTIYKNNGIIFATDASLVGDNGVQMFTNSSGFYAFGGFATFAGATLGTTSQKRLLTGVCDRNNDAGLGSSAIRLRANRVTVATNTTTGTSPAVSARIKYGARGEFLDDQEYWDGHLYESLVFAPNLDALDRAVVEKYLSLKHNIATSGYPTVSVGEEVEIPDPRTWTSYYPFVLDYSVNQNLDKGFYGLAQTLVTCNVQNMFDKCVAVGIENWSSSTLDQTSKVVGTYSRLFTATTTGISDTATIERLDGSNNIHRLDQWNYTNEVEPTTYTSTDDDFILIDLFLTNPSAVNQATSYIRFTNTSGTLAKTALFNKSLNSISTRTTLKIRKSDFTNTAGSPTWLQVSQKAIIYIATTSGTTDVYHCNWKLQIDKTRLFRLNDQIRIVNNVYNGSTWVSDQVFEGIISQRNLDTEDWNFEALPIIENNYKKTFNELESTPTRYFLVQDNFLDRSNILQKNVLIDGNEFLSVVRQDPEGFSTQWVFGSNIQYNGFVKNKQGVISQGATSVTYNSNTNADIISDFQPLPSSLKHGHNVELGVYLRLANGAKSNFDKIEIQWYNSSFTNISNNTSGSLLLTSNWSKFSISATVPFGSAHFKIKLPSAMNGATLEIDKPYLTSLMSPSTVWNTQYNGTTAYSNINVTNNSGSQITMECWYKGTVPRSIFRQQNGAGQWIILSWQSSPTDYRCILSNDGGTAGLNWPATLYNNQWHHIAMTWQQNTTNGFKIYFDGVLHAQRNSTNTALPNIGVNHQMMCYFDGSLRSEFGSGHIRNARIWSNIRTQSQLQDFMFKDVVGNETGLRYADDYRNRGNVRLDKTGNFTTTDVNTEPNFTDPVFISSAQTKTSYEPIDYNDTGGFGGRLLRMNSLFVPRPNNVISHNYKFTKAGKSTAFIFTSKSINEIYQTLIANQLGMLFTNSKGVVTTKSIYENIIDTNWDVEIADNLIYEVKSLYNEYNVINSFIFANNSAFLPVQDERRSNRFYDYAGGGAAIPLNSTSNYVSLDTDYTKSSDVFGFTPTQVYVLGSHVDAGYLFVEDVTDPTSIVTTFQKNKFMLDNDFWLVIENGSSSNAYPYALSGNALNMQIFNPRANIDIDWRRITQDNNVQIFDNETPTSLSVGDVIKMENKKVKGQQIIFDNEFVTGGLGGSSLAPYEYNGLYSMSSILNFLTGEVEFIEYTIQYIPNIEIGVKIKANDKNRNSIVGVVTQKNVYYSSGEYLIDLIILKIA